MMWRTGFILASLTLLAIADKSVVGNGPVQVREIAENDFLVADVPEPKKENVKPKADILVAEVFEQKKEDVKPKIDLLKTNSAFVNDIASRLIRSVNQQKDEEMQKTGVNLNAFLQNSHVPNVGHGQKLEANNGFFSDHLNGLFSDVMNQAKRQQEEKDAKINQIVSKVFSSANHGKMQALEAQNNNPNSKLLAIASKMFEHKESVGAQNNDEKAESESTYERVRRLITHDGSASRAISFAFSRFDTKKGPFVITTTNNFATFEYGSTKPKKITVQLSTLDDVHFVYGDVKCHDSLCRKSKVKTPFNENDNTGKGKNDNSLKYNNDKIKGFVLTDTAKLQNSLTVTSFGVATDGDNTNDAIVPPDASGYFGLGFKVYTKEYNTLTQLFSQVDDKFITIYRDKNLKSGAINVGAQGYDKCANKKVTTLYDIQTDGKDKQWWITADTISLGDKNDKSKIIAFDIASDKILLSKAYFDIINKQVDNNGYVKDVSALTSIKITLGNDVVELKPDLYTRKEGDKTKSLVGQTPSGSKYEISLGGVILKDYCVILNQADEKNQKYKLGFTVPEQKNTGGGGGSSDSGSATQAISVMAVFLVPLVQFFRF